MTSATNLAFGASLSNRAESVQACASEPRLVALRNRLGEVNKLALNICDQMDNMESSLGVSALVEAGAQTGFPPAPGVLGELEGMARGLDDRVREIANRLARVQRDLVG